MPSLEARTLCVDLDHTICRSVPGAYGEAEPLPGAADGLRRLRACGWIIVFHTARHFNHWQVTRDWLTRHEFEYDQIVFGKPPARYYVDDRAIRFEGDWSALCEHLSADFETAVQSSEIPSQAAHAAGDSK